MFVKQRLTKEGESVTVNGWFYPGPDLRDYNDRHEKIVALLDNSTTDFYLASDDDLPEKVDLRAHFPPIRNQGALGSCVAFGIVATFEYHSFRSQGKYIRLSERSLYKNMRFLLQLSGDSGGFVRAGMGAAKAIGIAPDKYWPYDIDDFDRKIPAEVQSLSRNYEGISYLRHDGGSNTPPICALASAKKYLAAGFPCAFAFYGFESFNDNGWIPMPGPDESAQWGHCVTAVGYDDTVEILGNHDKGLSKGAIIFRNSWGKNWGIKGYGFLPYDYFLRQYAVDMWTVLDASWLDSKLYGF